VPLQYFIPIFSSSSRPAPGRCRYLETTRPTEVQVASILPDTKRTENLVDITVIQQGPAQVDIQLNDVTHEQQVNSLVSPKNKFHSHPIGSWHDEFQFLIVAGAVCDFCPREATIKFPLGVIHGSGISMWSH